MYELRTLGFVDLRDAADGRAVHSILAQPKRLALLAFLAAGGGRRFHRRDTLLATFWPESTERQARHALSQSIYFLRQRLGPEAILTRGEDEVAVAAERIWCDAAAFDALLDAGDAEAALALYQGEMLPGFHLDDSQEFDRWLAAERERRRERAVEAARALAARLEREGNAVGATRWLQRAIAWAPFDEPLARELIALLDRLGDRAGALIELNALALRLGRDLELEPSEETRSLAEAIRTPRPAPQRVASSFEREAAPSARSKSRALRVRGVALGTLGIVGVALLLGIFLWQARSRPASADSAFTRVAVLPFDVSGNDRLDYLGEGMALMLSAKLDGAGTLRAVDPRAVLTYVRSSEQTTTELGQDVLRRFEGDQFALGSVVEAGGRLFLHIALYDRSARLLAEASADAVDEAGIFALVDDLTRALIAGRYGADADRLARLAALTTESLPALKAYLAGEHSYRAGRFAEAAGAFERAARADSTFALAHYRLSLSSLWADIPDTLPFDADARALRHAHRLSEHDRQLLLAYDAWRRGDADQAERLYRNILSVYPNDVEAWQQLGETLFHYNPLRGRPIHDAAAPFARVIRLDPQNWSAHWHALLLAASADRSAEFRRRMASLRSLDADRSDETELAVLDHFARGDSALPRALRDRLRPLHHLRLHEIAWRVGVHTGAPRGALDIARLALTQDRPPEERVPAHLDVAYLQLALGRDSAAHATLDAMRRIQPRAVDLEARAFALLLPLRTPSVSQLEDVRARMRDAVGQSDYSAQNVYTLGLIALGLGDTAAALAHASEIDRLGGAHYHGWAETLRAGVAYRSGRLDETVRRIAAAPLRQWFGWASTSPHNSSSTARWLRAEALRELGRDDAALGWYASFAEHATHDLALLAPSHLRRAEIHERRGEAAEAARHYARVIELWHDADPSLQPVVAFARQRLAALGAEAR